MQGRFAARLRRGARHARQLGERSVAEFFADDGPQAAAAVSYFTLFSLFPLAIITVAVYGLFFGGEEARQQVIDFVLDRVPLDEARGSRDLRRALSTVTGNATAFGVAGIVGVVFAASGLMGAIRSALHAAWETSDARPPLIGKLLDILLIFGLGLVIALSLALTLVTRLAVSVGDEIGQTFGAVGSAVPRVLLTLGQLTPVVVSFAVFAFLYRVIPTVEVRTRDVWPGAMVGALGFELVKIGFSVYLENFANYGAVYGSLATVVAFLVFVFLAANVMVLGAEAASEWRAVREGVVDAEEAAEEDMPLGKRLGGFLRSLVRRE